MSVAKKITYKDAGVDIERGDAFVERIKSRVQSTYGERVMSHIGGFAALFRMDDEKLLASGTDGVGTKVKIAQQLNKHDTIGIDLVAMCVNDIICTGAKPLFFLDYLATGKLEIDVAENIVKGIVEGCKQSGAALIGGETAEMPGIYKSGEYDLAGFSVGEVLEKNLIDGTQIKEGDTLIALPSSGIHSNGFSLVRKLIKETEIELLEEALTPTFIYWNAIKDIISDIQGMAHITGGGFSNISRINKYFDYQINTLPSEDKIPNIFQKMIDRSGLKSAELYQTFNMGVGFIISTNNPDKITAHFKEINQKFWSVGKVTKGCGKVIVKTDREDFIL